MLFFVPSLYSQSSSSINSKELIDLTNKERVSRFLPPLSINPQLTEAAAAKAKLIIKEQNFSHQPDGQKFSSLFVDRDYRYVILGENLATGFGSAEAIVAAWMNSQAHRDNILNGRYKDIGIAVIRCQLESQPTNIIVQYLGATLNIILSENLFPYQNSFSVPLKFSSFA